MAHPRWQGVYTVADVCRILRPTMTSRKVHYWLDTGLLSGPIEWGSRGRPTLLSYRQLLEIRTVQYLRDHLQFSLPVVRGAIEALLYGLEHDDWADLRFGVAVAQKGRKPDLLVETRSGVISLPVGQGVLDFDRAAAAAYLTATQAAWHDGAFRIPTLPRLETNVLVLAGAPAVAGTRVETAFIASLVGSEEYDSSTVDEVASQFRRLPREAIEQALEFEGLQRAA